MKLRVKNWQQFQHAKDRSPPWIKLYRDLLDDPDWHELDSDAAKILVMLWLIASEDENKNGNLPEVRKLCFRLRIKEKELISVVSKLDHWIEVLEQLDNSMVTSCDQTATPETETETETETEKQQQAASPIGFAEFWAAYPKRRNKGDAEKCWKRLKPDAELQTRILKAVEVATRSDDWRKDGGQFIPYPASWLNAKGWEDESPRLSVVPAAYDPCRGAI